MTDHTHPTTSPQHRSQRPKPLVFHYVLTEDADGLHALCGHLIPHRRAVRANSGPTGDRERVECGNCRWLRELDHDMQPSRRDNGDQDTDQP